MIVRCCLCDRELLDSDVTATKPEKRQGVVVDLRGPLFHGVRGAGHARGHGLGYFPGRGVSRRRHLRSGENVLAPWVLAVVLGPLERQTSSDDRQRGAGQSALAAVCGMRRASCSSMGPIITTAGFRGWRARAGCQKIILSRCPGDVNKRFTDASPVRCDCSCCCNSMVPSSRFSPCYTDLPLTNPFDGCKLPRAS